jgi:plasmid stabilization system protein ParE
MTRLSVSTQALTDTTEILERLANVAGIAVAERYASDLDALYERLKIFPAIGAPRPTLGAAVRIVVLDPYVVIYAHDPSQDLVRILRLVDGRRNITRRLLRR